jgi:hypothetical protein
MPICLKIALRAPDRVLPELKIDPPAAESKSLRSDIGHSIYLPAYRIKNQANVS